MSWRSAALDHAVREFPRESCGLVVRMAGEEAYLPCRNLATTESEFAIDPVDFARAEDMGEIMAVVHSHPNASAKASQADRVSCEASGLPWHIVSVPGGIWEAIQPSGYRAPYLGRVFTHGVLDCYSLIRDWYAGEKGISLPDFSRDAAWWEKGGNLYLENFQAAGFAPISTGAPLEVGDGILMQLRSKVTNHAAIYLGNDQILHHLQGRLSCRDVYGGYWKKITTLVVRHKGDT
jgi:proteasome lid subunit RPN8/RPN11